MKKAKKVTALFLTGSLALCAVSTNTNAGFLSRFFNSKYGGLAIASTLTSIAALTKSYVQDQKAEGGILSYAPFYLKGVAKTMTYVAKETPFFIQPAVPVIFFLCIRRQEPLGSY